MLEKLHAKMWNVVDLIVTFDLKPTIKQLILTCDRIAVTSSS